ncbi:dTDP-glucose 4,6-dehydratase [Heyndrickxia oleronia]|jgi:dTDP-glucose 4,6-dehydratase|uniref:dTDP-glucose 4,6-dehydratase n=1 Tax=Heyndrickxia oleronia TaxID=38875 RepID=UPI00242C57BF|nr:dTDP-glucose 4,6-dehydratase [Heyndrickxia oleronia]MCI1590687.1 dTDP-glucose 4,6-dehydratase [Heyndrickxia oleronia]MCI1612124.1 dTDP-glucose 4,6-dehydratase [Heyndrickxia oleronia]MCI1759833.1 dTDP-glucose 4,6-dehydratase [Heyndrickxia oleronia]
MNILVTGGAGFIGSNFITYLLRRRKDVQIVNLDKLTYAGNLENLQEVYDHPNHTFVQGDICDQTLVDTLFKNHRINGVIHFAAESHVDQSIKQPTVFIQTNILGTLTVLESARKHWLNKNGSYKEGYQDARFHHISTDEVFGTLGDEGYFTEMTSYAPNSPYSASKASSDMLVRSYFHTYGLNVITTNCSNNYGPRQHNEKLIPTIIRNALALEPIPIYGNGKNIRDWLFVTDHCRAIEKVFFEGKFGETYLIGGHYEKSNINVAEIICKILDKLKPLAKNNKEIKSYRELIQYVNDRPGHDYRYAIDDTKIRNECNWKNKYSFEEGINETIRYYLNKQIKVITNEK